MLADGKTITWSFNIISVYNSFAVVVLLIIAVWCNESAMKGNLAITILASIISFSIIIWRFISTLGLLLVVINHGWWKIFCIIVPTEFIYLILQLLLTVLMIFSYLQTRYPLKWKKEQINSAIKIEK